MVNIKSQGKATYKKCIHSNSFSSRLMTLNLEEEFFV